MRGGGEGAGAIGGGDGGWFLGLEGPRVDNQSNEMFFRYFSPWFSTYNCSLFFVAFDFPLCLIFTFFFIAVRYPFAFRLGYRSWLSCGILTGLSLPLSLAV
ncbi:hypothetical protein BDP27DRAFT_254344 [Rhodocollybia butyracea]|uniref:Uncharacterized protein n=1 Tax=Rhodocollybia butyracea TaxID=206335 RepID=A0A9P5U2X1_9AGAR|nr:hypothetical protein BDP27DRAFT_254344 [Rhodocollybia butyracea]